MTEISLAEFSWIFASHFVPVLQIVGLRQLIICLIIAAIIKNMA